MHIIVSPIPLAASPSFINAFSDVLGAPGALDIHAVRAQVEEEEHVRTGTERLSAEELHGKPGLDNPAQRGISDASIVSDWAIRIDPLPWSRHYKSCRYPSLCWLANG